MLVRQQDRKYEAELAKLRVTYAQWAAEQEKKIAETVVTEIGERAGLAEFVIYRQQKGQLAENAVERINAYFVKHPDCLLYTSPSPRDTERSRMPSSA